MGIVDGGNFFRGPAADDIAPLITSFRTQVNYMVRGFDHVHIVLDNDDSIAGVHQLIKHTQQFADVIGMQPGGRFIENINRFSGPLLLSSLESFTRWASPPDNVVAGCPI